MNTSFLLSFPTFPQLSRVSSFLTCPSMSHLFLHIKRSHPIYSVLTGGLLHLIMLSFPFFFFLIILLHVSIHQTISQASTMNLFSNIITFSIILFLLVLNITVRFFLLFKKYSSWQANYSEVWLKMLKYMLLLNY